MFSFKLIIKSTVVLGLAVMASAANASAPALSGLNLVNQTYAEGQGPMVIGGGITVTDPDSANLISGAISFSTNFTVGQDFLSVTPAGGITAAYDANTGVLTLTGSATLADYQATLRTLAYTNTDTRHPLEATRFIILQVNDGTSASNQGVLRVLPLDTVQRQRIPFCETFSTDGRGTRYQATNFFDVGTDDAFTRVKLPRATSSLTGTGGNDPYAWFGEDTDGQSAAATTLVFDLDTSGYSGVTLTLDLAAAPNAFESPDEIKIEQSVSGGAFTLVGAFRPISATLTNVNLARDADFNGVGEGAALGNAFTRHTVALASGSDCKVRITVMANATSDEIAIGEVAITGTPSSAAPQPLLYYDFEGGVVANLGTLGGSGTILGSLEDWDWGAPKGPTGGWGLKLNGLDIGAGGGGIDTTFTATQLGIAGSDSYTCAAWINFTKTVGDSMVFSQTNQPNLVLHNGVRNSHAHLGHWGNDVTGATTLSPGVWYHVVWLYERGEQSIYVNGKRDVGPEVRGQLTNGGNVIIGSAGPASWAFAGVLDEICIFDGALNYGQIRALAAGVKPTQLPAATPASSGEFYTAPFGPGGTWNLYEVVGVNQGIPATMYDAEVAASTRPNPLGTGQVPGHLPTLETREEAYVLQHLTGMQAYWTGITDDHTIFGGTEAVTDPNTGWVWTSGLPSTFRNWAAGEPNDSGAIEDGVYQGIDGLWNDTFSGIPEGPALPGQVKLVSVVEWNLGASSAIPGATIVQPVLPVVLEGPLGTAGEFGVLSMRGNGIQIGIRQAVESIQSGGGTQLRGAAPSINHVDPESPNRGLFLEDQVIQANTGAVDNNTVHTYKGRVNVTTGGIYTFGIISDDSFALRVRARTWSSVSGGNLMIDSLSGGNTVFLDRNATGGPVFAQINLPVGQHSIDFVTMNEGGACGHEVFVAQGAFTTLEQTPNWRLLGQVSVGVIGRPGVQTGGFTVTTSAPNGPALNNLANAMTQLTATGTVSTGYTTINFADPDAPGGGGSFSPSNPFPRDIVGVDDDNFAVQVDATVTIPVAGDYIFGFRSDDGTSLQIPGKSWIGIVDAVNGNSVIAGDTLMHNVITGDSNTRAKIHLTAGTYAMRGLYWEAGGGAHYELFADSALNPQSRLLTVGAAISYTDPGGLALVARPKFALTPGTFSPEYTLLLQWDTLPGDPYMPEYSYDLINWYPLRNEPMIATGMMDSLLIVQLQSFSRTFYHVRTW